MWVALLTVVFWRFILVFNCRIYILNFFQVRFLKSLQVMSISVKDSSDKQIKLYNISANIYLGDSLQKVKITVVRKVRHDDLIEKYENPLEHECDVEEGDVFIANGWQKPENFCDSAWESLSPFVLALANGAEDFYDGWMKNKRSAMISCNDGFRPVSFLLETMDDIAD